MTIKVEEKIARLDPAQRHKVAKRAADFLADDVIQRELRKAWLLSQVPVRPNSESAKAVGGAGSA